MDDGQATLREANAGPVRIEPRGPADAGLVEWETLDPATLEAGTPVQRGHLYDEDAADGYLVGVWEATAFDDRAGPYPVDEYMLLLEGTVVIAMPDGTEVRIDAGEAFVIPKGLRCQWKMPGTVRKIFMILGASAGTAGANPSLARVTKPPISGLGRTGDGAVSMAHTAFLSADGRMAVTRTDYPDAIEAGETSVRHRLVSVLAGAVEIDGARFGAGETAYLRAGARGRWRVAAGTRLIEASFAPGV
ncbi:cupin domain-containing protein [Rubrimonas sp.]|uniref:cupin domain-containing protein n=1 Tax=Rubrimonas sp. TaxID=2036015 RepID=UPI002FDD4DA7